jgi:hypothetical protein
MAFAAVPPSSSLVFLFLTSSSRLLLASLLLASLLFASLLFARFFQPRRQRVLKGDKFGGVCLAQKLTGSLSLPHPIPPA